MFTVDKKMSQALEFDAQEVVWDNVRDEVRAVNPELAALCDQINPGKKYPLFKISYPWGAHIVEQGHFQLPVKRDGLVSLVDSHVSDGLKQKLGYCSIPLSVVLHNKNEVFVETNDRIIPLNIFKPGDLFGIFETMNLLTQSALPATSPIWSVTAGGRSVFLLVRVSDAVGHRRLKKEFGIANEVPTNFASQWPVFKSIYNQTGGMDCWKNSILVFTESWFNEKNDDSTWFHFYRYLYKTCWEQMQLLRDATSFSLLWASFSEAVVHRNLKPRPYLVDTLKYLISIANGAGVGFRPATDESTLPVLLLQEAYVNSYNIKNYIPTMMEPAKLQHPSEQIYYSLAFPTVLENSPYVKNAPSIIEDERELQRLMETFIRLVDHGNAVINPIKHVNYEFFHIEHDPFGKTKNSKDIPLVDSRFNEVLSEQFKGRLFCSSSPFFRGCIRVSS